MESSGTVIPMSMDLHLSLWLLPSRLLVVQDRQTYCITLEMARRRSKRDLSLLSQLSVSSHSLRPSYYCLHLTSRISSHSHTWLLSSSGNRVCIPGHSWWKEGREDSCQLHCGSDMHITWEGGVFGGISVHGALFHCGWVLYFFILRNQQKNQTILLIWMIWELVFASWVLIARC